MDVAAEIGKNPATEYQIPSLSMEMSRLTRDGTVKPVSRDIFLRANGDREIFIISVQLTTSRFGNLTRLIRTLTLEIHTRYILACTCTYSSTDIYGIVYVFVCVCVCVLSSNLF